MASKSFGDLVGYAKFAIIILTIVTLGRWALGFAGVPYFPRGNVIFSIVLATNFLVVAYGGFLRAYTDLGYKQIVIVAVTIVVAAQLMVTLSTVISYGAGLETYFNHPEALNAQESVPFGAAIGSRLFGIFANSVTGAILASLGYAFGGSLPARG